MRKLLIMLLLALLPGMAVVRAQNSLPAIITFTSSQAAITVDAAERSQTEFTLSWHVINSRLDQRLVLQRRNLGTWLTISADDKPLPSSGSRSQLLTHPLDFGPPTYRLLIVDGQGQLVDERILTIPYEIAVGRLPEISLFVSHTPAVATDTLAAGSARVHVSWQVVNRLPTSNLVFEQVLDDGQAVPVELPRDNLWVASQGDGVVAPVPPLSGDVLRLRLRVVDVISGTVYAEAGAEVVAGATIVAAVPTAAAATPLVLPTLDGSATPAPTPTPRHCILSSIEVPLTGTPGDGCDRFRQPDSGAETRIASFSASTSTIVPGHPVTLNWAIEGAQFALLEVYDPRQLAQGGLPEPAQAYYDGLPATGSQVITLPESMTGGARFIVWAANLSTTARSPSFLYDRLAYRIMDVSADGDITSGQAHITAFVALPPTVAPGGEVTLSWNLGGADTALIELYDQQTGGLVGVFDSLPTIGSASIVIPDTLSAGARFVLWAANRRADGGYTRIAQSALTVPTG